MTQVELQAVQVGDWVRIRNEADNVIYAAGEYLPPVVEGDAGSFAVETKLGSWWFRRSDGRAYSGRAHVASVGI